MWKSLIRFLEFKCKKSDLVDKNFVEIKVVGVFLDMDYYIINYDVVQVVEVLLMLQNFENE